MSVVHVRDMARIARSALTANSHTQNAALVGMAIVRKENVVHVVMVTVRKVNDPHAPMVIAHKVIVAHVAMVTVRKVIVAHVAMATARKASAAHALMATVRKVTVVHAVMATAHKASAAHALMATARKVSAAHALMATVRKVTVVHAVMVTVRKASAAHAPMATVRKVNVPHAPTLIDPMNVVRAPRVNGFSAMTMTRYNGSGRCSNKRDNAVKVVSAANIFRVQANGSTAAIISMAAHKTVSVQRHRGQANPALAHPLGVPRKRKRNRMPSKSATWTVDSRWL